MGLVRLVGEKKREHDGQIIPSSSLFKKKQVLDKRYMGKTSHSDTTIPRGEGKGRGGVRCDIPWTLFFYCLLGACLGR